MTTPAAPLCRCGHTQGYHVRHCWVMRCHCPFFTPAPPSAGETLREAEPQKKRPCGHTRETHLRMMQGLEAGACDWVPGEAAEPAGGQEPVCFECGSTVASEGGKSCCYQRGLRDLSGDGHGIGPVRFNAAWDYAYQRGLEAGLEKAAAILGNMADLATLPKIVTLTPFETLLEAKGAIESLIPSSHPSSPSPAPLVGEKEK